MQKIICILFILKSTQSFQPKYKTVQTSSGPMKGYLNDSLYIWLGVPYATPPIESLRYLRPKPFPKIKWVYEAKNEPNACSQFPMDWLRKPRAKVSEDCLYLNIYTPPYNINLLPVVVWFHGEGYKNGAISALLYDPKVLVNVGNIVFVGIQYRLGSFGFLYTGNEARGNMGLYDQALALEWVNKNINGFGGNPNQITVMGQDAGANSAAIHIISNISNIYFHRSILQSSGYKTDWWIVSIEEAKQRAKTLGEKLDCLDFDHLEECLRNKDPEDILFVENNDDNFQIKAFPFFPFVPIVDKEIIWECPKDAMKDILDGKTKMKEGMSLLLGSNANEGYNVLAKLFPKIYNETKELSDADMDISEIQFLIFFNLLFKHFSIQVREKILQQYPNDGTITFNFRVLDQMVADSTYVCSTEQFAQAGSKSGNSVYRYFFDYHSSNNPSASWTGARHGDELEFTFGLPFAGIYSYLPKEIDFGTEIYHFWTSFISYGDPNTVNEPLNWPKYRQILWDYAHLNPNGSAVCSEDLYDRCSFWINDIPRLVMQFPNNKRQTH